MRVSDVIGRTIVGVEQERFYNVALEAQDVMVNTFILDNGRRVCLISDETGNDYFVRVVVHPATEESKAVAKAYKAKAKPAKKAKQQTKDAPKWQQNWERMVERGPGGPDDPKKA